LAGHGVVPDVIVLHVPTLGLAGCHHHLRCRGLAVGVV